MIINQSKAKEISRPVIIANRLDIGYQSEMIVQDINFSLARGQSLALVGVNGSGKTTLLKTLVGLLPALNGVLLVLDNAPGRAPHRIAYLGQDHKSGFILPLRAFDVVRMGRFANHGLLGKMNSTDDDLVAQAMKSMRILDLADKPLRSLSGGQQQRVHIAQVFARHADLLILDEPTAGLDAGAREVFQNAIQNELDRGVSLITATHDIQEAMNCNQAMLLARKVIAIGRGEEIITTQALMELFGGDTLNHRPSRAV